MKKEKIIKGNELLNEIDILNKSIANAEAAKSWYDLTSAFNRANLPNFLGDFEKVKLHFINTVKIKVEHIDKQIEDL